MLRVLSFYNISCALLYFLMFLMEGSYVAIVGIILVVILNFLVIKNIQQETRLGLIHFGLGICCMGFAGFLGFGLFHIVQSSIAHHYFENTWLFILLTGLFILGVVVHFMTMLSYRKT